MQHVSVTTRFGDVEGYETPFGIIALVEPRWLDVDNGNTGYQREFDRKWAKTIADQWSNAKFRPINVRLRDGYLYITNGQHTAEAASLANIAKVLVVINNGAPSRENEAREFVDFQTRVKRMRPFDVYRAALVARDEWALRLRKIAGELDITVSPTRGPGRLTAITAAKKLATGAGGEGCLRDVLTVASTAWQPDDLNRFKYEIMLGMAQAVELRGTDVVLKNAQRTTATKLFSAANTDAGGRGYVTISNIAAKLAATRGGQPRTVREG